MEKLLYFDTFNGVAGDMILGALIDMGLPIQHLRDELCRLAMDGYELSAEPIERQGLLGIDFKVKVLADGHAGHHQDPGPAHHHHSHHAEAGVMGFSQIRALIESSDLDPWIKEKAVSIFQRLARAEAKVHGSSIEEVHFHEVGSVDAIVDVVGACIGFQYFGVKHFMTAPLNLGGGTVTFSHGTWPVPTPATVELVRGFPTLVGGTEGELTTPTGAAIVTTLAEAQEDVSVCTIEKTGLGAGDREMPGIPNMLRLILGRASKGKPKSHSLGELEEDHAEEVLLLEANIDDMDAEMFGHFLHLALSKGALDVFFTPIHMKKNRPGTLLSLLCRTDDAERMIKMFFRETTTLGVRIAAQRRVILDRSFRTIETELGPVRIKEGRLNGEIVNTSPEFEDLIRLAEESELPVKVVRQKVAEKLT